jgi:phosphosulfolactate synthase (CoM biosynthesis protein A)
VKTYGADVNLFVDHSQILQLECLRRGVWGTNDTWGRIVTYRGQQQQQQQQQQQ